jgi:hypothetical protein
MWGARSVTGYEPLRYDTTAGPSVLNRMREWARGLFP